MRKHFLLIALICSIFVACGPKPELPTVATVAVDYITENSASCAGEVVDDGNADIITQGFCWSTEQNPTLHDNVVEGGYTELLQREKAAPVYFSADLSGLLPSTEYYVRAYATNSEGTAYGENIKFVTLEESEPETPVDPEIPVDPETPEDPYNGYEYVDMGFTSGVKWATCNVGATTPEGYGEHYAWGEIETKEEYTWQDGNCLTYGKDLGDISAKAEYDVATVKWGGNWRTPKLQDMYELVTQCTWIWANVNGVNGYNVVSNINGNHIFLPAAGFMNTPAAVAAQKEGVLDQGIDGYYWTTTPYSEELEGGTNTNKRACFVYFNSVGYMTDQGLRFNGCSIRPVID